MKQLLGLLFLAAAAHAETYCWGFLNTHPDRKPIPEAQAEEIQKGHMAHLNRMAREGHLLAAGPLSPPGKARGILVYRCSSLDEAARWTDMDPAVQQKRLTLEVYRWMGPDGVGEPIGSKLRKDPDAKYQMVQLPLIVVRKTDKWTGALPADVFRAHREKALGLLKQGVLRMGGPFVDEKGQYGTVPGVVGIFVFKTMSVEEALKIANDDPMVREGYATLEGLTWFVAGEAIPKP